jgi:hypothetical protein
VVVYLLLLIFDFRIVHSVAFFTCYVVLLEIKWNRYIVSSLRLLVITFVYFLKYFGNVHVFCATEPFDHWLTVIVNI